MNRFNATRELYRPGILVELREELGDCMENMSGNDDLGACLPWHSSNDWPKENPSAGPV